MTQIGIKPTKGMLKSSLNGNVQYAYWSISFLW